MSADMSGSGKSSSNEDKQKFAMADTNIVNERGGGTAGDMSATGKSSSTGDAYSLGDANIASQQGSGTVGRGSSASDAASLEPGMRPEKSMADKMRERDGGSGSASDARSRITGDLMSGDDSEMMGRDEETLEKRHQAAGPGGGSATDQGSIPMDFKGDEARQQQSEMSAEM